MLAISDTQLRGRNEIIDWLRHRGFSFARASWLERIHHNGGQLIYASGAKQDNKPPDQELVADLATLADLASIAAPALAVSSDHPLPAIGQSAVASLLAGAKGLRPLAEMILGELRRRNPGVIVAPAPPFVELSAPKPFAVLLPDPKVLKIYADFAANSAAPVKMAEAAYRKGLVPYPAVIEVNDARRVDDALIVTLLAANARTNGGQSV